MSENTSKGQYLYAAGDADTRAWFHKQWKMWPDRADEKLTTNISLHYGGVLAYRIENESEPDMSEDFASHVAVLDKYRIAPTPPERAAHEGKGGNQ